MGDHLWTIFNHLEKLTEQHQKRITYEEESGIRQEDANMFILNHLNISVPGVVGAPLLQSEVNLEAIRGQCVLVSGPSGCGKTSLFRICAGLQSIDAKKIILPARRHLLFIPQRPYLPLGSLRFQALFLLEDQSTISDRDLFQLFRSVNLLYLLERYALNAVSNSGNGCYINRYKVFLRLLTGRWYFLWVNNSVYPSFAC
jgi:putative ATP-binding cassette transporter